MNRINTICSYIDKSETFADVGCDHGYCAQYALNNRLCDKVFITDISAKCLKKAEELLSREIAEGRCIPLCCDGLTEVDPNCSQVLIAGMGGEEILKILQQSFIPRKFLFQPMKNADKLRAFLIENGCKITVDDIFFDGKYYFVIKGEREGGSLPYSEKELLFGRDSLKNQVVKGYAAEEARKREEYLRRDLSAQVRAKINKELSIYKGVAENDR